MIKNSVKHEDKRKFICPQCGISLSSLYNLKIHTETRCSTEKNHVSWKINFHETVFNYNNVNLHRFATFVSLDS